MNIIWQGNEIELVTWGWHNINQMSAKLRLYNVFDIGVVRIDKIENQQYKLVNNDYQLVITPADCCNRVTGVEPSVQSLIQNIMPFNCLIPHIKTDHPIGKSTPTITHRNYITQFLYQNYI